MIKKEDEKILKYEDLTTDTQRIWSAKTKVISVLAGATGTTSQLFRNYPKNITGEHGIKKLQKTAVFGTAHILREVLM